MAGPGHKAGVSGTMALYLGVLFRLGGKESLVSPSSLADELRVTPAAVDRMVHRMQALGLVERLAYKGVRLTPRGETVALRTIRYHRLAEAFLVRVMDYGWHEAHDLADQLAEICDDVFADRMEAKADFPSRCPHGEPIPTKEGVMPELRDVPLTELSVGNRGIIRRVRLRDPEKLQYLAKEGLVPEATFELVGRAPFGGPLRLRLVSGECIIGAELAAKLSVELDEAGESSLDGEDEAASENT